MLLSKVDPYPMPRVDDLIDQVGKSPCITTLDLTKGYWQVPVTEADRVKTTPFELFQFVRMSFGLQGAPATFQRMVDRLLDGVDFATAYIDDIIIFINTWEDHLGHIRQVLNRIKEAGLTLRKRKCQFGTALAVVKFSPNRLKFFLSGNIHSPLRRSSFAPSLASRGTIESLCPIMHSWLSHSRTSRGSKQA